VWSRVSTAHKGSTIPLETLREPRKSAHLSTTAEAQESDHRMSRYVVFKSNRSDKWEVWDARRQRFICEYVTKEAAVRKAHSLATKKAGTA
jgi:hypothetical protein